MQPLFSAANIALHIKQHTICEDVNFEIFSGEIIGLIGPNGSGKTTLLHTIAQLHPATRGQLYLHQKNITTYSKKQIAKHIAILFQETQCIFPQTVFEFCQSGRFPHMTTNNENTNIICNALETMELLHKKNQSVHTLSGGEKKRLAIATVFAQTPQLFLLDEPTNHLDIRHKIQLMNHLCALVASQQHAILISTHDLEIARKICHRVFMLHQGKLLQGDTHHMLHSDNIAQVFGVNEDTLADLYQ